MTNSTLDNSKLKAVFFDVAQTLLFKPDLYKNISDVLNSYGIKIPLDKLIFIHKLFSETVEFPDRTSKFFYENFNKEFLYQLGIISSPKMINDIFDACNYLQWEKFEDTFFLKSINLPMGIISNWDKTLSEKLTKYFDVKFSWILGSQEERLKKPSIEFYKRIIECTNLNPSEILYIGDSVKLDIEPASALGINTLLIDRINLYEGSPLVRIKNLSEISNFI
jgi:FMN phosphatase YigB (HAD superfamily)